MSFRKIQTRPAYREVERRRTSGMLLNLHLLRAIAALAVVYFHAASEAGLDLPIQVGSHGVDVFFVISGFIIAFIGARAPDRFLLSRVISIVPFYWTATVAIFMVAAFAPSVVRSTHADVVQLICSLFFIPRETAYAGIVPTLILGWSLNYEMYFYLLFGLALFVAPRRAPMLCAAAIVGIAVTIDASGVSHPTARFYARPLVFEFVYGIGVFYVFAAVERHVSWFERRSSLRWVLWLTALGAPIAIGVEEYHQGFGAPRFIAAGIPAAALVLAALLLERIYRVRTQSRLAFLGGESSYILYLIHPYVIYGLLRTVVPHRETLATPTRFALVIALLAMSTAAAMAMHLWFERPVIAWLRSLAHDDHDAAGEEAQRRQDRQQGMIDPLHQRVSGPADALAQTRHQMKRASIDGVK
jgi:exopolysaccharide production protein ExoZ